MVMVVANINIFFSGRGGGVDKGEEEEMEGE